MPRRRFTAAPLLALLLAACGGGAAPSATGPTPSATGGATPTPSATTPPTATATVTPSQPPQTVAPQLHELVITEYGVAITLPDSEQDATYRIDQSMATGATPDSDAQGTPFRQLAGVRIWTRSLAADAACASVTRDGVVAISVFTSDPSNLVIPSGPSKFKHIGSRWYGISHENGYSCTDGNPKEWPSADALYAAYDSIHAV